MGKFVKITLIKNESGVNIYKTLSQKAGICLQKYLPNFL